MDPSNRQHLSEKWKRNEAELHRLADLPVGATDPAQREAEIDAEQDEIEYALGEKLLDAQSEVRLSKYGLSIITQFLEALSHAVGRQVSGDDLAVALKALREQGKPLMLDKHEDVQALVDILKLNLPDERQ